MQVEQQQSSTCCWRCSLKRTWLVSGTKAGENGKWTALTSPFSSPIMAPKGAFHTRCHAHTYTCHVGRCCHSRLKERQTNKHPALCVGGNECTENHLACVYIYRQSRVLFFFNEISPPSISLSLVALLHTQFAFWHFDSVLWEAAGATVMTDPVLAV